MLMNIPSNYLMNWLNYMIPNGINSIFRLLNYKLKLDLLMIPLMVYYLFLNKLFIKKLNAKI